MAFEAIFFIICITVISNVSGCGQLPTGQRRTISFEVTGFKPPAEMAYTEDVPSQARVPQISTTEQGARTFVQNLIMRTVNDVLYEQGRGAALPDNLISLILQQLTINATYIPLKCIKVFTDADGNGIELNLAIIIHCWNIVAADPILMRARIVMANSDNCQIIGGTLTTICKPVGNPCMANEFEGVPAMHTAISGRLETTNVIMANWSTQMWQSVLSRVLRQLTSGSFASNFLTASVTLK